MLDFFIRHIEVISVSIAFLALVRPELTYFFRKLTNKIDFYFSQNAEIGFFDFGPTIGLTGTLRNIGNDQFISNMSLTLVRERDNSTHHFGWGFFRELSAKVTNVNVEESTDIKAATAFLLKRDSDKEVNIQFHDSETKDRFIGELLDLQDDFLKYCQDNKANVNDDLNITQEAYRENSPKPVSAYHRMNSEFYWEQGNYSLELKIQTDKPHNTFIFKYAFSLSNEEVAHLEHNKVLLTLVAMKSEIRPNFVNTQLNI